MLVLKGLAAGVVVIAVLVNGGYVYKTTCPLSSGGTQTSWTYGITDVFPYVRQTSAPCSAHTSTRLLLSSTGIWPLHERTSNKFGQR